ncbi:hypothetical protein [Deinococcus sonorensis]|uniref:Uncharacterized protein n=2 Tax=Deinococcus sonorensis TaxID=309891 RepID=A0AAU7U652_9DEIO
MTEPRLAQALRVAVTAVPQDSGVSSVTAYVVTDSDVGQGLPDAPVD